ncbi:anthranilate synthase component II [Oceanobacillus polygoni]|uniref:Anthranilate synthase/aminodeoxychorismate synthase-like glutamine amidotransferase n=1 Tax=Oceanobacillus polygoni TaxID=1235259 RepID=A0A9X0YVC3_9BACI|nr:aminodeoxychorismate/anthranilate synthase component II [Oceanobacillus polygoni]MBP2079309.1 anthranilate synthase/aminodeoxychorismate synthase-like glutamine amidotransferase [Oceanobacillus polygoni]
MILLIDNYDSFTYNLYQYFSELNLEIQVIRNDKISIVEMEELNPEAIIISPGPGLPDKAGICIELVKHFYTSIPILGVCLGHQVIGEALGGKVVPAQQIMHGKTSLVAHQNSGAFKDLQNPIEVMRYHSYVVDRETLPEELEVVAHAIEDGEIMGIKHRDFPIYGLQFHPESIGTLSGKTMIQNFMDEIRKEYLTNETVS